MRRLRVSFAKGPRGSQSIKYTPQLSTSQPFSKPAHTLQPYEVKYLDHTFFKDYSKVGHRKSIRTGYRAGDHTVNELRAIQYKPDGKRKFKLAHTDDLEEMPEPRRSCDVIQDATPATIPLLFKESRPIVQSK